MFAALQRNNKAFVDDVDGEFFHDSFVFAPSFFEDIKLAKYFGTVQAEAEYSFTCFVAIEIGEIEANGYRACFYFDVMNNFNAFRTLNVGGTDSL